MNNIFKIVLTGGPCGGKSTAIRFIREHFNLKGYKVLCIEESATELINQGIAPWTCSSIDLFQNHVFKLQLEKEKENKELVNTINEKVLVICDRGYLDCKAYMSSDGYKEMLLSLNKEEKELCDEYDGIFHLVSAAYGAEKFYTTENNSARKEGIEEARVLDDKIKEVWSIHPYFRVIDNSSDIDGKIHRLINEIEKLIEK